MVNTIGVLALQGNVTEHTQILHKLNVSVKQIRDVRDLNECQGLIIPGGESTTIMHLMQTSGLDKEIIKRYKQNTLCIFGTCAGAIVVSTKIAQSTQPRLNLINMKIKRNAYGRQTNSFDTTIQVQEIGNVKGSFIRAPIIQEIPDDATILSVHMGHIVALEHQNLLITTFHPELHDETSMHKHFIQMIRKNSLRTN